MTGCTTRARLHSMKSGTYFKSTASGRLAARSFYRAQHRDAALLHT